MEHKEVGVEVGDLIVDDACFMGQRVRVALPVASLAPTISTSQQITLKATTVFGHKSVFWE